VEQHVWICSHVYSTWWSLPQTFRVSVMLTRTWGTRPRTQQTIPRPQKNNCSRPRTNITDYGCHQPTNRSNLFPKINYGRLGLPWQPVGQSGHYILQPFAWFIYLFLIYFLIFHSWISETAGDSSAELSRQVACGAGIERLYLRVPKFRWGDARVKKGQKFHGLSRFATADGRLLTWADRSPLPI